VPTAIFLNENTDKHDDGDSFVRSPFSLPISIAEVDPGSRKKRFWDYYVYRIFACFKTDF